MDELPGNRDEEHEGDEGGDAEEDEFLRARLAAFAALEEEGVEKKSKSTSLTSVEKVGVRRWAEKEGACIPLPLP